MTNPNYPIDVTTRVIRSFEAHPSGITYVQLEGDAGYDWVVMPKGEAPTGYIRIGGLNNGSQRICRATALTR